MIDLRYVFRRAREITWRHKRLWGLGFLAGLGMVSVRLVTNGGRWEWLVQAAPPDVQRTIGDLMASPYVAVVSIVSALLVLIVSVGLWLLGTMGRVAQVDQVRAAEEYSTVDLRAGWRAGIDHLWPVCGVRLLLGLPLAGVVLIGALPVAALALLIAGHDELLVVLPSILATEAALFTCLVPAILLAVALSVPLSVLQRLAIRACVLEELAVRPSIGRAWEMLRTRPGLMTLVWAILQGIGLGALLVGLPLTLILMLFLAATLLTVLISPTLFVALALLIEFSAWLVTTALGGVLETLFSAVWTLVYREVTGLGRTGAETLLEG